VCSMLTCTCRSLRHLYHHRQCRRCNASAQKAAAKGRCRCRAGATMKPVALLLCQQPRTPGMGGGPSVALADAATAAAAAAAAAVALPNAGCTAAGLRQEAAEAALTVASTSKAKWPAIAVYVPPTLPLLAATGCCCLLFPALAEAGPLLLSSRWRLYESTHTRQGRWS
jgi:hypothetical protein